MAKNDRPQINLRADEEILEAIDEIRASYRPIPSMSQLLRMLVMKELKALRQERNENTSAKAPNLTQEAR